MDNCDVDIELNEIKNLLFLMGDVLDGIKEQEVKYHKDKTNVLVAEVSRGIDPLITLQSVIYDKVLKLENKFD